MQTPEETRHMAVALKTLRPLYQAWRREQASESIFWQALIQNGEIDGEQMLPALPLAWLPGLYERLAGHGKRQGVYYTPAALADFLTAHTLGRWLAVQYKALCRHPDQARARVAAVMNIKILDPSCGTGVFLQQALWRLADFYRRVRMHTDLDDGQWQGLAYPARYALTYQLYGVDIDEVALLLAREQLLRQAIALDHAEFSLLPGASNIKYGNALCLPGIVNTSVGDRAGVHRAQFERAESTVVLTEEPVFSWESAFPEVTRGWDFLLGNPPYMTEVRGESGLLEDLRTHPVLRACYAPKMDLCDAFLGLSVSLLKQEGCLGLVLPEYWMSRSGSRPVRDLLWREGQIQTLWGFGNERLFDRAPGHHTSLLVWWKTPDIHELRPCAWGHGSPDHPPREGMIRQNPQGGQFILAMSDEMALLEKLARHPGRLQPDEIQQGVVIPQGTLRARDWRRLSPDLQAQIMPGSGIFILSEAEVAALNLNAQEIRCLRPYYAVQDFQAGTGFQASEPRWLIYADQALLRRIAAQPEQYENLCRHLDRFATLNTSAHAPYGLHRARQPGWFESPDKILCARQVGRPLFSQVVHPAYVTEGFYSILVRQSAWWEHLPWLVACLNSPLAWFWFYHHKRKGSRLQIDKDVLLGFPLPDGVEKSAETAIHPAEENIFGLYGLSAVEVRVLQRFVHGSSVKNLNL